MLGLSSEHDGVVPANLTAKPAFTLKSESKKPALPKLGAAQLPDILWGVLWYKCLTGRIY